MTEGFAFTDLTVDVIDALPVDDKIPIYEDNTNDGSPSLSMSDPGYHDLPSNGLHLQRRVTDLRTARPMKIKLPGSKSCLVLESSLMPLMSFFPEPIFPFQ